MHVSTVFELVCLDLSMHLTSCWICRPTLVSVGLVTIGECLPRKLNAVFALVIRLVNLVSSRIALVDGLATELISGGELRDGG